MTKILIPANDPCFPIGLAKAYQKLGCEAIVGVHNFFLGTAGFDMIHFLWPESFCLAGPPDERTLEQIRKKLEWWSQRCMMLISVNNYYPHGYEGHPAYKKLYGLFYERCAGIHHFSNASRDLVVKEWPVAATKPNIVTTGFNYAHLLRPEVQRKSLRESLGFKDDDLVILAFGALRTWSEVKLLTSALARVRVANKRILMVCRYTEIPYRLSVLLRHKRLGLWRRWHRVVSIGGFVADEELYRYFEPADVVVVPRVDSLSSGVPSLAMTFGRMVIVPNRGAYPEYVAGTGNLLYKPGDAASLAGAIEQASRLDREKIGEQNRRLSAAWTWDRVAQACLELARRSGARPNAISLACA